MYVCVYQIENAPFHQSLRTREQLIFYAPYFWFELEDSLKKDHCKRCKTFNRHSNGEMKRWSVKILTCVSRWLWAIVAVAHIVYVIALLIIVQAIAHWILSRWHDWCRGPRWWWMHWKWWCTGRLFRSIHIRFLLSFADIFLVPNTFVTKPIANLRNLKKNRKRKQ